MRKIAVIFESSPFDRKGLFNAVHNRIVNIAAIGGCKVEPFCLQSMDNFITRRIRHTLDVPFHEKVKIDDVEYSMLWYRFSIIDHIRRNKFHVTPKVFDSYVRSQVGRFKDYDMISAHSYEGGYMAMIINEIYGIPYHVTWHGSDIHTHPVKNPYILSSTRNIMQRASCNFFVSNALMKTSSIITEDVTKKVLYNGASDSFVRYDEDRRRKLRIKYGLSSSAKVVAYVGNLHKVKNVDVLPLIYKKIVELKNDSDSSSAIRGSELKFWLVGDGKLRSKIEPKVIAAVGEDAVFWGNIPHEEIVDMMNCIDVLILPSRNEGQPLVLLEALRCGADVVGSDVGGIAQVIGHENVIPFSVKEDGSYDYSGTDFVNRFAQKVIDKLLVPSPPPYPDIMDWKTTAISEYSAIEATLAE